MRGMLWLWSLWCGWCSQRLILPRWALEPPPNPNTNTPHALFFLIMHRYCYCPILPSIWFLVNNLIPLPMTHSTLGSFYVINPTSGLFTWYAFHFWFCIISLLFPFVSIVSILSICHPSLPCTFAQGTNPHRSPSLFPCWLNIIRIIQSKHHFWSCRRSQLSAPTLWFSFSRLLPFKTFSVILPSLTYSVATPL